MPKLDSRGGIGTILLIVLLVLMLIGSGAGLGWALVERANYKTVSEDEIQTAVDAALERKQLEFDQQLAADRQRPFDVYTGPSVLGSISFQFPRDWSVYATESNNGASIDTYFNPGVVPGETSKQPYALRLNVETNDYSQELRTLTQNNQGSSTRGSIVPFVPPRVTTVQGVRFEGRLQETQAPGILIMFPLRDKTVRIWTENLEYRAVLDSVVESLQFQP